MRRRNWVLTALAVPGALAIGWGVMPPAQRQQTAKPLPARAGEHAFNGWVKIHTDGQTTVMLAKSEMGQGVSTALAMVLADELDADWAQVRMAQSPIDGIYGSVSALVDGLPFHPDSQGLLRETVEWLTAKTARSLGLMMTGGSSSIKDLWGPMRQAGAAARQMLVATAAQQWGVPADQCSTANGRVLHAASQRSVGYGELAAKSATQTVPEKPVLKTAEQWRLIGQPMGRLDGAAKSTGKANYGIDTAPEGLLYASVRLCPTRGGSVANGDADTARGMPGVVAVGFATPAAGSTGGVLVVADRPWRAKRAAAALKPEWNHGAAQAFDSAQALQRMAQALDTAKGFAYWSEGDADAALTGAAKTVRADYTAPYLAHQTLEPANCTVQVAGEGSGATVTVWAPTQMPGLARLAAARVAGVDQSQVTVHVTELGGGFGRRLESDFVAQATQAALLVRGKPVQLLYSREDDTRHDFYRPACASRWVAGLDASGRLLGVRATSVGQAIVPQVLERVTGLPGGGPDKTTAEGAFDQPYEWPAGRIAHEAISLPLPIGFWRAVGHSHQAFFKESFVDELAHAAGRDPLAYRLDLLKKHPRHAALLQKAAALAGWGTAPAAAPDGAKVARGLALHQSFGSIVAQVAEVSVSKERQLRVHRVVAVIDCGTVVNPNIVRQQMESAIIFGLSAALYGEVTVQAGQVQPGNFGDAPVLRLNECPQIVTDLMPSTAHPEGVGEPGTPPIAPAVANALFALTGQRLRSLPLRLPAQA